MLTNVKIKQLLPTCLVDPKIIKIQEKIIKYIQLDPIYIREILRSPEGCPSSRSTTLPKRKFGKKKYFAPNFAHQFQYCTVAQHPSFTILFFFKKYIKISLKKLKKTIYIYFLN